ncbi:MAG: type II toxin-antitoxin system HicB family antitoxin [Chloroflexota bacterium]
MGEVPQLRACYTQGRTLDELMENIKEVIKPCLEERDVDSLSNFVGVQRVEI